MLVRLSITILNRQRFMTDETEWTSTLKEWTIDIPNTNRQIINKVLHAYWKDRLLDWSIILHN